MTCMYVQIRELAPARYRKVTGSRGTISLIRYLILDTLCEMGPKNNCT